MSEPASLSPRRPVVLITGMSGAGRTTALKQLEDLGFEAFDNLPLDLIDGLLKPAAAGRPGQPLAFAADVRTRQFDPGELADAVGRLADREDIAVSLLFLDCDDDLLARRFTETRRRHPLAEDRPVGDGIHRERQVMALIRARADVVLDTSALSVADLKRLLRSEFAEAGSTRPSITCMSFGFRSGLPREADLVFDVRFLSNPHYCDELAPLTGRDPAVAQFIKSDEALAPFFDKLRAMVIFLLPYYQREGKSYLTIAIGCTGGGGIARSLWWKPWPRNCGSLATASSCAIVIPNSNNCPERQDQDEGKRSR